MTSHLCIIRGYSIRLRTFCAAQGLEMRAISSVTGEGVEALKMALADKLDELRAQAREEKVAS